MAERHTTIFGDQIDSSVVGVGLSKDGNDNIQVNYDDVTIGIDGDTLEIKDGGVDTLQMALDSVNNTIVDLTDTYDFSSGEIQVKDVPDGGSSAVNKNYVDGVISGLDWKDSVRLATYNDTNWNTNVSIIYSAPTLTITGLSAGSSRGLIDSVEPVDDDRILIKDAGVASAGAGADDKYNCLWKVTGGTTTSLTLIRTEDADTDAEVTANLAVFAEEGTELNDTAWVLTTDNPIVLNTTPLTFAQFNGSGTIIAGAGLDKSGNTLFIGDVNKGVQVNADDLEIDASEIAGLGLAENSVNSYELDLDLNGLVDTAIDVANDSMAFIDSGDSGLPKKESIADLMTAVAGEGLTATNGVIDIDSDVVTEGDLIFNEIPSGLINSVNTTYTLANTPIVGTVTVYLNGQFQAQGVGLDYTISGGTITFTKAPRTNSNIYVNYVIA